MRTFDITKLPRNMREKILPSEESSHNDSQCWDWLGATNSRGYGSVTNGKGSSMLTHRRAYELLVGPIPKGLTIDHLCFNKVCVNTDHMEPVTGSENSRRSIARQTHCKRGHELKGENLRVQKRKNGLAYRICRACALAYQRAYQPKWRERRLAEGLPAW